MCVYVCMCVCDVYVTLNQLMGIINAVAAKKNGSTELKDRFLKGWLWYM